MPNPRSRKKNNAEAKADAELILNNQATNHTLMPPSVAQGLVSREEFVNLLVVTYTEKLEAEVTALIADSKAMRSELDVKVNRFLHDLAGACREAMRKNGVAKLAEAHKELTGVEPEINDDLPDQCGVEKYESNAKGLPSVRFDRPEFFAHDSSRDSINLVDVLYYRIFGLKMAGRPSGEEAMIPVQIYIGKKPSLGKKRRGGGFYRHPMEMFEDMMDGVHAIQMNASISVAARVVVPEFTEEQKTDAYAVREGYKVWDEKQMRWGEINEMLRNGEKLRRKALAIMTAQALGEEGVKALPALDVKL